MSPGHELRQFLLLVFALLIPCFALWTAFSAALGMPATGLSSMALQGWFPTVVDGLFAEGPKALLMTEFGTLNGKPVPPGQSDYQLGFSIDTRTLSYSIPFYTALHFATQKKNYLESWCWGMLTLYLLLIFGLIALAMKELMVNLGGIFFEQAGVWVPHPDVIGIAYQLNVLIIPTLAPVALWAWQNRESALLRSLLPGLSEQQAN
tara:strand:+ start:7761 stop:8378 length:618 start_codon:yes stop_codon:yes gene_type:complete